MAVTITVKSGTCHGGFHEVGQETQVERGTPAGMCWGACGAVLPYLTALRFGADFPWESEKGCAVIHCPDPKGIVLELRRED
ncbi:MAG: TIGR04076 family protein [Armatimonadota bacterium]